MTTDPAPWAPHHTSGLGYITYAVTEMTGVTVTTSADSFHTTVEGGNHDAYVTLKFPNTMDDREMIRRAAAAITALTGWSL